MEIKTGFENLDSNLAQDLIKFVQDGLLSFVNHDKETIIRLLQDGYRIIDHFQGFDEHIDNLILNTIIPNLVNDFLPKANEKIIKSIEENI